MLEQTPKIHKRLQLYETTMNYVNINLTAHLRQINFLICMHYGNP